MSGYGFIFGATILILKGNLVKSKEVTVYSCSGCSNVAQLANSVAVKLDRSGIAKMSCIAGVGGDVKSLVKVATTAEKILALDGCPLQCVAQCLKRHNIEPTVHLILTDHGFIKNSSEDVTPETVEDIFQKVSTIVEDMQGND